MNGSKRRNFDVLAAKSRRFQKSYDIERENETLWTENQKLYQRIQELQILIVQAERDAEEAYNYLYILTALLPKGEPRKKAQQALTFITQKRNGWIKPSRYTLENQFNSSFHEVFDEYDEYDECGGYRHEGCRQKKLRNQRRQALPGR